MAQKKLYLVDMHTHLNEKKLKTRNWWEAAKKKNLCAIAITEHSNYSPKNAYYKLKLTQPKNIILIPGLEAKTTAGDLLIYGTDANLYEIKELQKMNLPIKRALELIKEHKLVASFAHPFGYKDDSVCEVIGEKKTKELIQNYVVGVEYYNGMLGSANQLLFGRALLKRVYSALTFVEKNKLTKTLMISKGTKKPLESIEALALETLERVRKGMLFSKNAKFITVGSDAHYPNAIGTAIIQLKNKPKNEKEALEMIRKKKILWAGPNLYSKEPVEIIGRKEMLEGLTYLTKKKILMNKKGALAGQIRGKISLGKRIKTIKRITKKVRLKKIRQKIPRIRLKKRIFGKITRKKIVRRIKQRKIVKTIKKKLGLVK